MNAPIVIFAFNRVEPLKQCVESLLRNREAADSPLIVFVDGPRDGRDDDKPKVDAVRQYASTIQGFLSVELRFSEKNKKLGPSIIAGVTDVINEYGRAIVVEDDLVLGSNFLSFINQGLDLYQNRPEVFSVCGYTNKVKMPSGYAYDAYFCPRSSSWGWATWKDRWNSCDWQLEEWETVKRRSAAFNRWGGSDCFHMLKEWKEGGNQSWAIRFCYNEFAQGKLSLFPAVSHVQNNGFDGEGTNCKKWSRFESVFDTSDYKTFRFPDNVAVNKSLRRQSLKYHSLYARAFSKLMYLIYR